MAAATQVTSYNTLLTRYKAPNFCSNNLLYTSHGSLSGTTYAIFPKICTDGQWSSCYIPGYCRQQAVKTSTQDGTTTVVHYSPAVCPSGWTNAVTTIINGQTTAACCPYFMSPDPNGYACTSTVTKQSEIFDPSLGYAVTVEPPFIVTQINVVVTWASSDLDSFTPKSAPILAAGASASRTGDLSQTTTPLVSPTPQKSNSSRSSGGSGLSTGGAVGVGVGAAIGGILLLALLYFAYLKGKRARRSAEVAQPVDRIDRPDRPEVGENQVYEASAQTRRGELDPNSMRAELNPRSTRAELDGNWRGYEVQQSPT